MSTVLLGDGSTILAAYPKGHGTGQILLKRSDDGGRSWSERLPTPENWSTSKETPTLFRLRSPRDGRWRLVLFSGLYPMRRAISEDNGQTWTSLEAVGEWGGIVGMGDVVALHDGTHMAFFHDDGRFFTGVGRTDGLFTLYTTRSSDGGVTWSLPQSIWSGKDVHLCEPGAVWSPDGKTLVILLRENRRIMNSHMMISKDEGRTWSAPREVNAALTGDRHTARYCADGRLVISFRDMASGSPTHGDWVAWVGTFGDIIDALPGQYLVRLKHNTGGTDCGYPGVEVLRDGAIVATTYGHWDEGKQPYIVSVRLRLDELD